MVQGEGTPNDFGSTFVLFVSWPDQLGMPSPFPPGDFLLVRSDAPFPGELPHETA